MNRTKEIKANEEYLDKTIANLKKIFDVDEACKSISLRTPTHQEIDVIVDTAFASGEMLLTLRRKIGGEDGTVPVGGADMEALVERMQGLSFDKLHRTTAVRGRHGYELYYDVQMLLGDEELTQVGEIDALYKRIKGEPLEEDGQDISAFHAAYAEWKDKTELIEAYLRGHRVGYELRLVGDDVVEIDFTFGTDITERVQRVQVKPENGYAVFTSKVVGAEFVKNLSSEDIIKYTWIRNGKIDLVEFVLDNEQNLTGMVVHPFTHMQPKEFMYLTYTLAVEVDRLQMILHEEDVL